MSNPSTIKGLKITIKAMALIIVVLLAVLISREFTMAKLAKETRVRISPVLPNFGQVVKDGFADKESVFTFAHFFWTQLNTWDKNGEDEYLSKIKALDYYTFTTKECDRILRSDYSTKKAKKELKGRTRSLSMMGMYKPEYVEYNRDDNTWNVQLPVLLKEEVNNYRIKDRALMYHLKIGNDNRDPVKNEFGFSLQCQYKKPDVVSLKSEVANAK